MLHALTQLDSTSGAHIRALGVDPSKFKEGVSAEDLKKNDQAKIGSGEKANLVSELSKVVTQFQGLTFFEDDFEKDDDSASYSFCG